MSQIYNSRRDRKVKVNKLIKWHTYKGYIEEMAIASLNNRQIEKAVENAKKECSLEAVYVFEPKLIPGIVFRLTLKEDRISKLPRITCNARLLDHAFQDEDYAP